MIKKATIELTTEEDEPLDVQLKYLLTDKNYRHAWEELFQTLRKWSKYEDKKTITIEDLREKLMEIQNEYDIGE